MTKKTETEDLAKNRKVVSGREEEYLLCLFHHERRRTCEK